MAAKIAANSANPVACDHPSVQPRLVDPLHPQLGDGLLSVQNEPELATFVHLWSSV